MPPTSVGASRRSPLKPAGKLVNPRLVKLVRTVGLEVSDLLFEQRLPQVLVVDDLSVPVGVETELAGSDISGERWDEYICKMLPWKYSRFHP